MPKKDDLVNMNFNTQIRQILLLSIILLLSYMVVSQLRGFVTGFLGAITLYILSRQRYFKLTVTHNWKKGWTALLFIFGFIIIIGLPIFLSIKMLSPKLEAVLQNGDKIMAIFQTISKKVGEYTGAELLTDENLNKAGSAIASFLPSLLNSTTNLLANLAIMLFTLYFMLVNGIEMEKWLNWFIPFKQENIDKLAAETRNMVTANAIGIPVISIIQGLVASIGYWIFGVHEVALWGFLTGVFAFFPIVGTMIVWAPLVIFMYATGHTWQATGLMIYSFAVTGNVDYITRLTLMRKMADVHPLITVFGVIVGLGLFGFVGIIFGPLLLSYIIVLAKIYVNEFVHDKQKLQ